MNYLNCPSCKNSKSWQDGGSTSIPNTEGLELGLSTYYCMKCGYYEQEKHSFKVCTTCKGDGHTDSSEEVIASGTMTRDELRRRLTEDFFIIQGKDPSDIYAAPREDWVDPEDIKWLEDDDGEDEGTTD